MLIFETVPGIVVWLGLEQGHSRILYRYAHTFLETKLIFLKIFIFHERLGVYTNRCLEINKYYKTHSLSLNSNLSLSFMILSRR
jgi:hypothetical protein